MFVNKYLCYTLRLRSCPLFRKSGKFEIFRLHILSAKTSNFWAKRFVLCFSLWLDIDDCGKKFPYFAGQVCTILVNSKAHEIALFAVSRSHLHYNVIQHGCEAILG